MAKKKTTKKKTVRATKGAYVDLNKKKAKKKTVKKPSKSAKRVTTAKAVKPTGVLKRRSKVAPIEEAPVAEVMSAEDLFSDDEDTMQADDFDTLNHEDEADADLADF